MPQQHRQSTDNDQVPPEREYASPAEASKIFGVSIKTLEQWRRVGNGPAFVKLGKKTIRYHLPTFRAWMESRTVNNTAEAYYMMRGELDVIRLPAPGNSP